MVTLLAKIFIQEKNDQAKIREEYGVLCGVVGILFNVLLFAGKFLAGTISHSIAITADAVNNLSDAGSSIVTLAGFKLAGTKPDPEHPFGHGRIEYISGLVVAAAILLMAYELIRDSVGKIVHPEETEFSGLIVVILVLSILVKLYMYFYNHRIGKKLDSAAMQATAIDSLSDTCATTAVLAATLIGHFTGLHIDGWCGVLVGVFILYAGISAAKETLNPLLGQPPAEDFVMQIDRIVMSHPEICGIHDLIVHDYGPGHQFASLHIEFPAETDPLKAHDVIDNIENDFIKRDGLQVTIHYDPIVTTDAAVGVLRTRLMEKARQLDPCLSIHDLRIVPGDTHTNVLFDLEFPAGYTGNKDEMLAAMCQFVHEQDPKYSCVVKVEQSYASAAHEK